MILLNSVIDHIANFHQLWICATARQDLIPILYITNSRVRPERMTYRPKSDVLEDQSGYMTKSEPTAQTYKPSTYLRERRPERYSDSIITEEPQITQDILEYHLETLTNRSQEKEFEHFARRLAEKELCPNLLPQTGPTGGGDSKVDSETYPVAEEISLRWYQGDTGAKDRWAFAMSAKKDWRGKVKSDVKKIAGTDRGYLLIYFITNQFVRDKVRAQVEDDLKKEFGIAVRILDRSWIVDRVMNHDLIKLAAQTLSIESLQLKPHKKIGPLDAQREIELKELDEEITDPDRYAGIAYQLAEDCLRTAILASELERDRYEVEGRFAAALRVAEKVGDRRQILRIAYHHAWASCFIYDDIEELSRLYNKVEELGLSSQHADDVEMVNNLWNVLLGAIGFGHASKKDSKLVERGDALRKKLEELSGDDTRPNNSLHAQTMLCFFRFTQLMLNERDQSGIDAIFDELTTISESSRGLGQYPFDSYKRLVYELGDLFADNDAYEKLFDTVVAIQEERTSEGEAGSAITNRGIQKFRAGKIYDAIRLFGRAQEKLIKDEYQHELVKCLVACGGTYKAAGLYWAARTNLLAALSICITEHNSSGLMHHLALLAAKELAWIEVKLGRVPHILFILTLTNYIANHLQLDEEGQEKYRDFFQHIDAIFSMVLLRSNLEQLETIKKIPHLLEQLNLVCSEGALLFALGHIDKLRKDVWFDNDESTEKIEEFYELVCMQPANDDLPPLPELCSDDTIELKSDILGMNLVAHVDAYPTSILIAESLLGALEAFLATSLTGSIIPYKQVVKVAVRIDKDLRKEFGLKLIRDSENCELEVIHKEDFALTSADAIKKFRDTITDFIIYLLPKITLCVDTKDHIRRLAEEENVFGRCLIFSDVMTLSQNVFGSLDWINLSKVSELIKKDAYQLERTSQWRPKEKKKKSKGPLKPGEGEAPEHIANTENLKHSERKILSLINIPAWDKAQWSGLFFMIYPEGQFPPCIGLLFKNREAAMDIFVGWLDRLGKKDEKEELRISIVTGVDKNNPAHYRVHIGTNINTYERIGEQKQFVLVSRINTMTPDSDKNLSMFLKTYEKYGVYCLLPAILKEGQVKPEVVKNLFLFKKSLIVKPAWQIGDNDEDFIVLQPGDEPIIPEDVKNAPVLKALERKQKMNRGK